MKNAASLSFIAAVAISTAALPAIAVAQKASGTTTLSAEQAREEDAYTIGLQAFLWGYPLHEYARTLPKSVEIGSVYINDFRRFPALKTAADKFVVTPNNVTIDAYAMLDLATEPVVIFVPSLREQRWYIVQIGDAFDEIAHNVGGTKGQQAGVYLVTGPGYGGPVPGEMTQVKLRTKVGVAAVRSASSPTARPTYRRLSQRKPALR
jgi:hypothetical protein